MMAVRFDKYDRHGAIHWRTASKTAVVFNAPLSSRYNSVLRRIPPDSRRILDIGCGDGYLACAIAKAFRESMVVGLDSEEQGILIAKVKASGLRLSNVEFSRNTSPGLPFADRSFDTVVMTDVIEHLPDPLSMLAEIKRVTRPGGTVIVTTPNRQEGSKWDHRHDHEYTADELRSELEGALGPTRIIGSWHMDYIHSWRKKRLGRIRLDLAARLGRNAFDEEVANPTGDYGQLTAISLV